MVNLHRGTCVSDKVIIWQLVDQYQPLSSNKMAKESTAMAKAGGKFVPGGNGKAKKMALTKIKKNKRNRTNEICKKD